MPSKPALEDVNSEAHPTITIRSSGSGNDSIKDGLQLSIGLYTSGNKQQQQQAKITSENTNQIASEEPYLRLGRVSSATAAGSSEMNPIEEEKEAEALYRYDAVGAKLLKQQAREQLRLATVEKAYAEHARELARRQVELAEAEFAHAKRIREQAQVELNRAQLLKQQASRCINSTCMEITCHACKQHNQNHVTKLAAPELNAETCLSLQLMMPHESQLLQQQQQQQQQLQLPFNPTVSSSVSSEITNSTSKQDLN